MHFAVQQWNEILCIGLEVFFYPLRLFPILNRTGGAFEQIDVLFAPGNDLVEKLNYVSMRTSSILDGLLDPVFDLLFVRK